MKRTIKEPSTWAGLAGIFQAIKFLLPPQYHMIADGATALAGMVAVKMKEAAA